MIWTCTKEVYSLLLYQIKLWWAFCFFTPGKIRTFVSESKARSVWPLHYGSIIWVCLRCCHPKLCHWSFRDDLFSMFINTSFFLFQFFINYFLWSWQDLNLQHTACKAVTLPLSYSPIPCFIRRARWETWTLTCWVTTNNSTFELTEPLLFNDWWSIKKPVSFYINKNRGGFILI